MESNRKHIEVPAVKSFAELDKFTTLKVDFVDWPDQFPYCPKVIARLGHTDGKLMVRFEVEEMNAKAVCLEPNGPVWEDSCVEFFVKVPGDDCYFNFETNCIGTGLAAKRKSREDFRHFSPEEMAAVIRRPSLPRQVTDITDASWSLELEIPFSTLGLDSCPARLEANFYKCGDKTAVTHFVSWSPVGTPKPDFHRPEYFGELILL